MDAEKELISKIQNDIARDINNQILEKIMPTKVSQFKPTFVDWWDVGYGSLNYNKNSIYNSYQIELQELEKENIELLKILETLI